MKPINKHEFGDIPTFTDADDPRLDPDNDVTVGAIWIPPANVEDSGGYIKGNYIYRLYTNVYEPGGDPVDYTEWKDLQEWDNLHSKPAAFPPTIHSRNGPEHKDRLQPQNYIHYPGQIAHLQILNVAKAVASRYRYFN